MCLNTFLKAPIDLHSVIDHGRVFHNLGAAILKSRSPKPLSLPSPLSSEPAMGGLEPNWEQCVVVFP